MKIPVNEDIYLDEIKFSDRNDILLYFKDKEIADNTLRIPYPYTESDVDHWLNYSSQQKQIHGHPTSWAIREKTGRLIGGIGFAEFDRESHKVEIGYWLAKPFWGKGIMTETAKKFCGHVFKRFPFVRISAHVFEMNLASKKVLEKAGFTCEGRLRKFYKKNGKIFDALVFSILKEDVR